jgi:hypothetical protein
MKKIWGLDLALLDTHTFIFTPSSSQFTLYTSYFILSNDKYILKSKRETKSQTYRDFLRAAEAAIELAC